MGVYGTRLPMTRRAPAAMLGVVLKPYLPTWPQLARETIAVLLATVAAAWIISKVPEWRALVVRDNSIPSPLN